MIRMTKNRIRRSVGATSLTAALVLTLGSAGSLADTPPDTLIDLTGEQYAENPTTQAGNPECSSFTVDGETPLGEIHKFDNLQSNYKVDDELSAAGITVTVTEIKDGGEILEFDWTSTSENVVLVIVKSGNDANLYVYNPASDGDTGLTTVAGAGGSHISFCSGDYGDDTTTTTGDDTTTTDGDDTTTTDGDDTTTTDGDDTTTTDGDDTTTGDDTTGTTGDDTTGDDTTGGDTTGGDTDGTQIGGVDFTRPAASFDHVCATEDTGVVTVTLSNTGNAPAEFTVVQGLDTTTSSSAEKVTVAAGGTETQQVTLSGSEVLDFVVTSGTDSWTYLADNDPCVTEVAGVVIENPPAPVVQGEQLAATGFESPDLLLLAMLFAGLGLALLLSVGKADPLTVRTH